MENQLYNQAKEIKSKINWLNKFGENMKQYNINIMQQCEPTMLNYMLPHLDRLYIINVVEDAERQMKKSIKSFIDEYIERLNDEFNKL